MHVVHATWIPNDTDAFRQDGALCIWVETDARVGTSARKPGENLHPQHLTRTPLAAFMLEKLGVAEAYPGTLINLLRKERLLLPTGAGKPLPSYEMSRYVDDEPPDEFGMAPCHVWCHPARGVIPTLNQVYYAAATEPDDFQLGADLLFWHQLAQEIKPLVARDQYIPALKYRALDPRRAKGASGAAAFELHPTWEAAAPGYEAMIQRYAAAMPAACAAGLGGDGDKPFSKEPLLRHFAECLMHDAVAGTPFPDKLARQFAGTVFAEAVRAYPPAPPLPPDAALRDYRHWLAWRADLAKPQIEGGFTLCFRLEEADPAAPDAWRLHFLAASRDDPSRKLSLADYWHMPARERAQAARHFGARFDRSLLLALGHAARVYPKIWEGLATSEPSECRLTLEEAFAFLKESAWVLQDAGFTVIVPAWWTPEGRRRAKIRLRTAMRSTKGSTSVASRRLSAHAIVASRPEVSIDGQPLTEQEWRQLVASKAPLVHFRGQWLELDRARMEQMLRFWQERQRDAPEMSLADLLKIGAEVDGDVEWDHEAAVRDMLARLEDKGAFAPVDDPAALNGELRDYQRRGLAWLQYLEGLGLNPCLADDMGLGKTIEVIARLLDERDGAEAVPPTLVIAPTSVLGNWRREIERFAPSLRVAVHQGNDRAKEEPAFLEACRGSDVVLTSFALARLDEKLLRAVAWHRVVVDEAQNIKNPQAAQTKAILKLAAPHRMALTGTPVENRLRDLWSIFNFLNPGYLGKEAQFRKAFELPIHKENDREKSATLKKLVEPFILRRVKTDQRIIDDLPDKIEQTMRCTLTPEQASLYEAVVKEVDEQIESAEGIGRRGLILATLLRLKQICNHPAQFLQDGSAFTPERSHKLQRLGEMLDEVIAEGESALIFTQFAEIGAALERYLAHTLHYSTHYLHGGTPAPKRDQMVAEFQDPDAGPAVFILSLRAGGVGLNLTKANHVFHFDRWWNPAVEDQATDRAFRIGQRRNVFVHKFLAMGTVEEKIDALIEDKRNLSSLVVGTDEAWLTELDNDTFKNLIALQRSAVVG